MLLQHLEPFKGIFQKKNHLRGVSHVLVDGGRRRRRRRRPRMIYLMILLSLGPGDVGTTIWAH